MRYSYRTEGKILNFQGCRGTPLPHFLHLVGHPDLSMRKTLWVFGMLTVMIFF